MYHTLSQAENLGLFEVIGNSSHTNSRRLPWSQKFVSIRNPFTILYS